MPENPLLPNAQLQALHSLLTEAVNLRKAKPGKKAPPSPSKAIADLRSVEALLAGTVLQLHSGDVLVDRAGDPAASRLSQAHHQVAAEDAPSTLETAPGAPQLLLADALASALRQAGSDRIVFTLLSAVETQPNWAETLTAAQEEKHPLVIACADASGAEAFRGSALADSKGKAAPWSWTSVQRVCGKLKLPILSVDGEDAVAVYRVMQESVLRARSGGGPALLWAMLPSAAELGAARGKAATPLRRLEHYLRARSIPFSADKN